MLYGVESNKGDVVEQSPSEGVNCSEMFQPRQSFVSQNCFVTDEDPQGRCVSLQFTPLLCDCSTTSPI